MLRPPRGPLLFILLFDSFALPSAGNNISSNASDGGSPDEPEPEPIAPAPDPLRSASPTRAGEWAEDDRTCKVAAGCPALHCFPPADGFTCDDCVVSGQNLQCSRSGMDLGTMLLIIILVIDIVLIGFCVVWVCVDPCGWGASEGAARQQNCPPHTMDESLSATESQGRCDCMGKWRRLFIRSMRRYGQNLAIHRSVIGSVVLVSTLLFAVGLIILIVEGETTYAGSRKDWAPIGGRLEREMNYVNKWTVTTQKPTQVAIMIGPKEGCIDLDPSRQEELGYPTRKYLELTLLMFRILESLQVDVTNRTGSVRKVGFNDFCLSLEHPLMDVLMPGKKPCSCPSVLDCFWEGSWTIDDVNVGLEGTAEERIQDPRPPGRTPRPGLTPDRKGPYVPPLAECGGMCTCNDPNIPIIKCPGSGEGPEGDSCPHGFEFPEDHPVRVNHSGWPIKAATVMATNLDSAVCIAQSLAKGQLDSYRYNEKGLPQKPSFRNMTDVEVYQRLNSYPYGCKNWMVVSTQTRSRVFGGYRIHEATGTGAADIPSYDGGKQVPCQVCGQDKISNVQEVCRPCLTIAEKFVAYNSQFSPMRIREWRAHMGDLDDAEIHRAIEAWIKLAIDEMRELDEITTGPFADVDVSVYTSYTHENLMEEMGSVGISLMIIGAILMWVLAILTTTNMRDCLECPVSAGFVGVIFVLLSITASFGFVMMCGIDFNHLMIQVLPFFALGLGVDDMFLLLQYYGDIVDKREKSSPQIIGEMLEMGGISVSLTSASNAFAFFMGTVVPIPALRSFLIGCGVVVLFNYITMINLLPVVLSFHIDCMRRRTTTKGGTDLLEKFTLQRVIDRMWVPLLCNVPFLAAANVIAAVFLLFCIASLVSVAPLELGFDVTDFAPRNTYIGKGLLDIVRLTEAQIVSHDYVVTRGLDIPNKQRELMRMHRRIALDHRWSASGLGGECDGAGDASFGMSLGWIGWLHDFADSSAAPDSDLGYRRLVRPNSSTYCNGTLTGAREVHKGTPEYGWQGGVCTGEGHHHGGWVCRNSHITHMCDTQLLTCRETWYVPPEEFYAIYHCWRDADCGGLLSLSSMTTDDFGLTKGNENYSPRGGWAKVPNMLVATMDSYYINMRKLSKGGSPSQDTCGAPKVEMDPDRWLAHIEDYRTLMAEELGSDGDLANAFPYPSGDYEMMESFASLREYFWLAYAVCCIVMLLAAIVVPVSFKGSMIVAFTSASGTIELTSLCMYAGLKFQPILAVILVMSIGLMVEFSAHFITAYETYQGTREQRTRHAATVVKPTVYGLLTSFLGIVMLSQSDFPYVRKYSFQPFAILIGIGCLHGLLFVPALCGLVGWLEQVCCGQPRRAVHREPRESEAGMREIAIVPVGDSAVRPSENGVPNNNHTAEHRQRRTSHTTTEATTGAVHLVQSTATTPSPRRAQKDQAWDSGDARAG